MDSHGATKGGAEVTNWSGNPMESVDTYVREFNPFSPSGTDKPYSKVFATKTFSPSYRTFPDVNFISNRQQNNVGAANTKSAILGKYQLVLHNPSYTAPYTVTGNVQVNGVLAFHMNTSMLGIKARVRDFRELPGTFTAAVPGPSVYTPSNLPVPTFTGGMVGGREIMLGSWT